MCDTQALLTLAARFRENARQTDLVEYKLLMLKAALSLEQMAEEEAVAEHTLAQTAPQLLQA